MNANEITAHQQQAVISAVRAQLAQGGTARLRVTSSSMAPLILAGDEIEVASAAQLEPGDIVMFEHAGTLMTHRLIGPVGQGGERLWLTQGDNLLEPDLPWPEERLVGRVAAIISRRGPVVRLKQGAGRRLDAWLRGTLDIERGLLRIGKLPKRLRRIWGGVVRRIFYLLRCVLVR